MSEAKSRVDFDEDRGVPVEEYENLARKFIPGYDGLYSLAEVLLAENLPEAAEILVVGAGGGKEVVAFGKRFPDAHLTGVDPSEKMLGVARELVEKNDLQSRVALLRGTIEDVKEQPYDAGTALLVMHFLPDDGEKLSFLEAIHRRLKPGAKLILADGCFDRRSAEFDWLMNAYQNHARLKGAPPDIIQQAVKMIMGQVYPVAEERELELLRAANFGHIRRFFQGLWCTAWVAVRL